MRLQLFARLGDAIRQFAEDVFATGFGLQQGLLQDVVGQTIALDIHLRGGDTILRTRHLEVHVAQVVLIAEDVAQHGILLFARVLDKTHGDTRYGLLNLHTGIHQCQRTGTNRSHGRRAVGFENIRYYADDVGIVGRNLTLQRTPSQMAVTNLTTPNTALSLGFAGREGGEVIVQQEALLAMHQHVVDNLLVELRTQGNGRERLRFTTGKDG